MKKSYIFCTFATVLMAVGVLSAQKASPVSAETGPVSGNVAENWVNHYSPNWTAEDITGGVKITGPQDNGHRGCLNEGLELDGLSFIYTQNIADGVSVRGGFYFTKTFDTAYFTELTNPLVFTMVPNAYNDGAGSQSRAGYGHSHDTIGTSAGYMEMSLASNAAGVALFKDTDNPSMRYTFNKLNSKWWKVSYNTVVAEAKDASHLTFNTNYDSDTGTNYFYIPDTDVAPFVDEDGLTYLHPYMMNTTGTDVSVSFTDMKYVEKVTVQLDDGLDSKRSEAKDGIDAKIKALKPEWYGPTVWGEITSAVTTAKEAIDAAEDEEGIAAAVSAFETTLSQKSILPESEDYELVVTGGQPAQYKALATENGVVIGNHYVNGLVARKKDKVILDGASFTFHVQEGVQGSGIASISLAASKNSNLWNSFAMVIWTQEATGQDRLHLAKDHSSACSVYPTEDCSGDPTCGVASSVVMNKKSAPGATIRFDKVSKTIWKITIGEYNSSSLWEANSNYNKDTKTATYYVPATSLGLDSNEECYFNIGGWNNTFVYIENFVNGTHKDEEADLEEWTEKINAFDASQYLASMEEFIATAKATAIEALTEGMKESEARQVYDAMVSAIDEKFAELADYETLTQVDMAANARPRYDGCAVYGAKRYDNYDAVQITMKDAYGVGAKLARKYAATNFHMQLHLGEVPVYDAIPVAFSTSNSYISESKYFAFEFYKTAEGEYLVTFGLNGTAHNESAAPGWETGNSGSYKGRLMKASNDMFNITLTTDFETGIMHVEINEQTLDVDTAVLFGEKATEDVFAGVVIGAMGDKSTAENHAINVLVSEVYDITSAQYFAVRAQNLAQLETLAGQIVQQLQTIVGEGLTDETVDTFIEYVNYYLDMLEGAFYECDFYYYVYTFYMQLYNYANTEIAKYNALLQAAAQEVLDLLDSYDPADYREEQQEELAAAKAAIIEALMDEEVDTVAEIEALKEMAKATLDAIKTDAQLTAEEEAAAALAQAKADAKAELDSYADLDHTDEDALEDVANLVREGRAAIDAATTIEEVNEALAQAKAAIDAKKAEVAAAKAAAAALAAAKEDALAEIDEYVATIDMTQYSEENQAVINGLVAEAKAAVNAATSEDVLAGIVSGLKTAVAAVEMVKKGCGSSILAMSGIISMVAMMGAGLLVARKRKED